MIQIEKTAPAAPSAPTSGEPDPVVVLARHMRELQAQGRPVTRDELLGYIDQHGSGLTGADIDRHGSDAAELARRQVRQVAPQQAGQAWL